MMGRALGAVAWRLFCALALAAAAMLADPSPAAAQTPVQPPPQAPLTTVSTARIYYRMTVNLEYHSEPTTIEVVVACNVRVTNSRLTGQSYDASRLPDLYGVRQKDGKAILVQTPDACSGETTADGRVPPDFLPIVVVYQNADDMKFGIGYFSEDAYENPLSELKFKGATIAKATREEWEAWRKTAPPNALRPEMRPHPRLVPNPPPMEDRFSAACYGMRRLPMPPEIRARVRQHWPDHQPRYWRPSATVESELRTAMWSHSYQPNTPRYDGKAWTAYMNPDRDKNRGLPTRVGDGRIRIGPQQIRESFPPPVFPERSDQGAPWIGPHLRAQNALYNDIEVDADRTKGFMYCYARSGNPIFTFAKRYLVDPAAVPELCRIDGSVVESDRRCDYLGLLIFERDEFVFADHGLTIGDGYGGIE